MFVGNLHHDSITVAAKTKAANSVRLVVSEDPTMATGRIFFGPVKPVERCIKITATDLTPKTQYYYCLELDSVVDDDVIGKFRTPARPGEPYSFTFWASSCASGTTGYADKPSVSNNPVFDEIRSLNPLFGLHMGDFHYRDIAVDNPAFFDAAYDDILRQSRQAQLYREIPTAYTWDDHDFGPNNANKNSPSKISSRAVYRKRFPHYDLPSEIGMIYQTFAIGRVRFICLDVRSERDPITDAASPTKTILGTEQKAWLKAQLLAATEPVIFLEVSVPWVANWNVDDDWWHYQHERTEIAAFIKANNLEKRIIFLAGDAHMLAIDDGRNNTYEGIHCPMFQLASLDSNGSTKGGPYSIAAVPGNGQFGLVSVTDNGNHIVVRVEGRKVII